MEIVNPSLVDCNPRSKLLSIDGEVTDALNFILLDVGYVGVLERLNWRIVHQPEPGVRYYAGALKDAMMMGATYALTVDEDNSIGYIVPICCILEHGIAKGYGVRQQITLPLSNWHILFDGRQGSGRALQSGDAS